MFHYVAFLCNSLDRQASLAAAELGDHLQRADPSWKRSFGSAGMNVYIRPAGTADRREHRLPLDHGVIIGCVFPATLEDFVAGREPAITARDAARYLESAGRQLTEDYWGAYIAFLTSPQEPRNVVLRDPSGKMPCYRLRHRDVEILFADIRDLSLLPLPRLTLNLEYLAAFIHTDSLQVRASALTEVTEILAGESFEVSRSTTQQRAAWDPRSIAAVRSDLSFEEAASRLRRVTQACIDAWASVHGRVLHCLSGGLDSSIVLGCLSLAPSRPAVLCMNRYVESEEGDERLFARIAAEYAKARLIEARWDPQSFAFDARMLALPRSVKPSYAQCARLAQVELTNPQAEIHQADAVWKGQGGDHLFLNAADIPSASDYAADHGLAWGLARAVRDTAQLSFQPYACVLRSALACRRARSLRSAAPGEHEPHFVCPDALPRDLDRYLAHPWTLSADEMPPGRERQIRLLAEVVNRHRPLPGKEFAYEHHPLLSQPIIEHCLRTPSYLHLRGGRRRALARHAFGDCVPPQIVQREDKGGTTSFLMESVRAAEPFLCELLLDGVLVRERVAQRSQLEACLRDGQALKPGQLSPLIACIAAEIWARAWSGALRTDALVCAR